MKKAIIFLFGCILPVLSSSQDLSEGYKVKDLKNHPMQALSKPAYLGSVSDPSFEKTKIIRITDAGPGNYTVPLYNTIQAWNADESLMIVYGDGSHQLLNGVDYSFIRKLSDIQPADLETIFWHFTDPDILFYIERGSTNFVKYNVNTQEKSTVVNIATATGCTSGISFGNDVQMMSWDSDVFSFRCGNTAAYYYRISTSSLTQFNIADIAETAPMPFPSGNLFYHRGNIYNSDGDSVRSLHLNNVAEHSCLGKLSNGDDAYFAISFDEVPGVGCQGSLVAHNATTGNCYSATPSGYYGYPKSGTHISALAHKNSIGGWVAVSMMGFEKDGQSIFDQEIIVAQANESSADIYRVAHHRSDEDQFDYWGEPHVTISPSGTRLLFGSDWSGDEDGESVDCYIAELYAHTGPHVSTESLDQAIDIKLFPNPANDFIQVSSGEKIETLKIYSMDGKLIFHSMSDVNNPIDISSLSKGLYLLNIKCADKQYTLKFIK